MPERTDPRQAAKLAQVQQIRLVASEAAMVAARDGAARATADRRAADRAASEAQEDWRAHLGGRAFEPERARDLAARMIERDAAVRQAQAKESQADERHLRSLDEWQLGSARADLAEAASRKACRAAARRSEERSLAALSDRITYRWMRS